MNGMEECMFNKISLFMVLFVSAVFLSYIPGACWAQPPENTGRDIGDTYTVNPQNDKGIDKTDTSPGNMNVDQQGQINQDRDNTGINKRDTSPDKITADQQGQTKEELELTQKIRQAVVDDKSLSTYAHNVKIITVNGMVTLRGPVRSEDEKRAIEEKAGQIAGKDKIKSEIEIAP